MDVHVRPEPGVWMSGWIAVVEWPRARVWSSRPPPGQLRMIRRGLVG
jgi:hypothetical protein